MRVRSYLSDTIFHSQMEPSPGDKENAVKPKSPLKPTSSTLRTTARKPSLLGKELRSDQSHSPIQDALKLEGQSAAK